MLYNGTVKEIPNNMNQNYFFDNLNYSQRQKIWVSKKCQIWRDLVVLPARGCVRMYRMQLFIMSVKTHGMTRDLPKAHAEAQDIFPKYSITLLMQIGKHLR
jgi:hypothetical protein